MKTRFDKSPIFIIALVCLVAVLISSCKKSDPEPIVYGDAKVRVVNAVSASQAQDFYQGDNKISTTALAFGASSTSYYTVGGGPSTLTFKNTGTSTATASSSVGLEGGASYTIFYYTNSAGNAAITGAMDDTAAPAAGKAKVRFVNLGFTLSNSLNIAYTATSALIIGNLGTAFSNYYSLDPALDLSVTVAGAPVSLVVPGTNFVAGKIYTVWFDAVTTTTVNYHVVVQN
jgi:hypothetical protein